MSKRSAIRVAACTLFISSFAQAAWPPSNCTHVEVLGSGDTDQVSWRFDGSSFAIQGTLENAGRNQLDTLGESLDMLPEFLCQAVRKVAFVNRPPSVELLDYFDGDDAKAIIEGWTTSDNRQNIVHLNSHSLSAWNESTLRASEVARRQAIHRVVHESAHLAVYLLQSQQKAEPLGTFRSRPDPDLWPSATQQMAKDIIAANRLQTGVMREWERIHGAFVGASMAQAYYGSDWPQQDGFSSAALAKAGFMSAYGGDKAREDIAEMTSWAIVRNSNPDSKDAACSVMNSRSGASVKSEDAAVFTKLGFIHSLSFIPDQTYRSCVGTLKINASGPGFHSYKNGNLGRSYTGGPEAWAGRGREEDAEWLFFEVSADGAVTTSAGNVPVSIMLSLNVTPPVDALTDPGKRAERLAIPVEDVSFPRGVYFVGFRHSMHNRMQITRKDDGGVIMDVGQGLALIGSASTDAIEGSVVVQRIINYSGGLLSAIAGDEPVSEPSRITFRYEP
jgi:hypothetical protein